MIFTIAIPTYNNSTIIEKCIKSCLSQDFRYEFEILVVDNASTDNTPEILANYSQTIRIIQNNHNVGLWGNHNVCLRKALGDYIVFCHSDDVLLPDCLSKCYEILERNRFPNKFVTWGKSVFRDFQSNWEKTGYKLNECKSGDHIINAFLDGGLAPSGTCYSRQSFAENGGFIVPDVTIAPSDMVSMWKLIFDGFFFEMSSEQFFTRVFASTARDISRDQWVEAKIVAVENFMRASSDKDIDKLKRILYYSSCENFETLFALNGSDLINASSILKKYMSFIINNPKCLVGKKSRFFMKFYLKNIILNGSSKNFSSRK